jgi:hypothetical protein
MNIITIAIVITKYAVILMDYCNSNKDKLEIIFTDENGFNLDEVYEFIKIVSDAVKNLKTDDVTAFVELTESIAWMKIYLEKLRIKDIKYKEHVDMMNGIVHEMEYALDIG